MAEQKRASFAVEDMKQGGGNLWGSAGPVRAKIVGGRFTKEAPDNYTADGNPIFGVVDFELAGEGPVEERRVNQSFSLGASAGDNFTISPDGDYLIPVSDDAAVIKDSKFGIFASSLQNEGVSRSVLAEFGFAKITGLDGDWKRIEDKARNFQNANKKQTKFAPSTLCLVKLHGLAGEAVKTGAASVTKTAAAPAANQTQAASTDLDADTYQYLEQVLKAKGGTEQRGRLTLGVSKVAMADPNRQALARRAAEETFLQSMVEAGVITYDAAAKGQPVTLVQ